MKTIELTDEQYSFLENMAKEMVTQSNRASSFPLFCVYEKELVPAPEDIADHQGWHNSSTQSTIEEDDEIDEEMIKEYIEEHPDDKDLDDEDILVKLGYEKIWYNIKDVSVSGQVYFTEKAALEHIRLNDYHYREPFVYAESVSFRNYEMQFLMQLMKLFGPNSDQWRNAYGIRKEKQESK